MAAADVHFDLFQLDPKREMLTADRAKELGAKLLELARAGPVASIKLSGKSFGKEATLVFAEILKEVRGVVRVDFADIIAGQETEEALEVLQIMAQPFLGWKLVDLDLSDNALGFKGSRAIAQGLAVQDQLERFIVCNDGLQAPAAEVLTDLLTGCQPDGQTKLRVFETFNNLLECGGAIQFSRLFRASPHLVHMRFASTRVSSEGGMAIAEALKDRKDFEFLDISDNSYGKEAGKVLADGFFRSQPKLHTLKIGDTSLGESVFDIMARLCHTAPGLQVLDLNNSEIEADRAEDLAKLLLTKPELTVLNLSGNELQDRGLAVVAAALRNHQKLTSINLCETSLSSRSVATIVKLLLPLPSLEKLSLDGNGFTAEALEELEAAVEAAGKDFKAVVGSLSDNDEDFEPEDEDEELDLAAIQEQLAGLAIEEADE